MQRRPALAAALLALIAVPAPASATDEPLPFTAPRDPASYDRALQCLTEAVYYEARSESADGQRAVAQVVLNRVRHPNYPDSVCGVVYQGSQRRTGCQFTFTCDGSITGYIQAGAWARAQQIATAALRGAVYRPVGLSLNYHTTAIRPYWAPSLQRHAVVGAHVFYRPPGRGTLASFNQSPSAVEPSRAHVAAVISPRNRQRPLARLNYVLENIRVEVPVIERPRIERPIVEGRSVEGRLVEGQPRRRARPDARTPQPSATSQAQARPRQIGPRSTMERGVRVARGS